MVVKETFARVVVVRSFERSIEVDAGNATGKKRGRPEVKSIKQRLAAS